MKGTLLAATWGSAIVIVLVLNWYRLIASAIQTNAEKSEMPSPSETPRSESDERTVGQK